MALDTQDKRAAAIHVGLPWRGLLPQPDAGALDAGDRQQVCYLARVTVVTTYEVDVTFGAGAAIVLAMTLDIAGAVTFPSGTSFVTAERENKTLEIVLTTTFLPLGITLTIPWDGSPLGA